MGKTITEAPAIKLDGVKTTEGKSKLIVDNDIIDAMADFNLGEYKLMLYYLRNAEGWKTSEADILKRTGLSSSTYKRARKSLAEGGYITLLPHESVTIHINFLLSKCQNDTSDNKDDNLKNISKCQNDTSSSYQNDTSVRCQNDTYNNINNNIIENNIRECDQRSHSLERAGEKEGFIF